VYSRLDLTTDAALHLVLRIIEVYDTDNMSIVFINLMITMIIIQYCTAAREC